MRLRAEHSPYDAHRLLWFLGQHAVPALETWDGTTYSRVLRLPHGPGTVALSAVEGGYDAELALSHDGDQMLALAALAHLLDLSGDPTAARRHLRRDPVLGPLVRTRPGLRVPGSVDHVETLVRTVIGQQVSLAGARTVTGRVVAALGAALPPALATPGLSRTFPTPAVLAAADPAALPMPRARGRSVVAVAAAAVADGEQLVDGSPERGADLLALPGVGPWTAGYQALRAGRDPDVFLPTDLAVRRSLERLGHPGDAASASAQALAWSPHRSLALLHLWTDLLESRAAPPGAVGG